ncbi:hypothetical protein P4O66_019541 [Electrophorus voltai]|uniref:Protein BUD31 homolog n=1 Tax=Electrophorus voltai TaxID=2609070 RepID=A0AAD8ZUP9_9TELE|nr:hypothetical protein P4O66_019541 [Electrophorus voltai]
MPKVKRSKKPPPDAWELIEPTLDELDQKMREAETEPHEGKRKVESLWPIFRLHHQRSRYIFDLFYKRKTISRELYEYCIKEGYADKNLIAKWKKQGYENLCCLRCIQTRDTNFGTNCICRVPKSKLEVGRIIECSHFMPKVRRSKKPPPDAWELIEPTLEELDQKMREAETEPHEGKRKVESLWPIFRLHHQRSRYIFDLFYKRKAISRELYEYCIKEGYADKNLIAKWKKQGYENLCCLRCIQTRDTNFGTNCICRVPKSKLEVGRIIECSH